MNTPEALLSGEHVVVLLPRDWVNGQGKTFAGVYVFKGTFFIGRTGGYINE